MQTGTYRIGIQTICFLSVLLGGPSIAPLRVRIQSGGVAPIVIARGVGQSESITDACPEVRVRWVRRCWIIDVGTWIVAESIQEGVRMSTVYKRNLLRDDERKGKLR